MYFVCFGCRGCAKITDLDVEMEHMMRVVIAMMGREEVGCASGSGGGTVEDKVGEDDEIDVSSHLPGRRLREGKVTGRKETRRKETGRNEKGRKEMGVTETGGKIREEVLFYILKNMFSLTK